MRHGSSRWEVERRHHGVLPSRRASPPQCILRRAGTACDGQAGRHPSSPALPGHPRPRRDRATVRETRYAHTTRVDVAHGRYDWDCSGMAAWVLARAVPDAEREIERARGTHRPLARDYHGAFMALPSDSRSSWRRVTRLTDAEPGDVIAWVFPPWVRASITGHVAILVARPVPVPGVASRYRVRVADSTTVPHAADTRPRTAASGFGYGDIEIAVDPHTGAPVAYRWNDRPGRGFLRTSIALARPSAGSSPALVRERSALRSTR